MFGEINLHSPGRRQNRRQQPETRLDTDQSVSRFWIGHSASIRGSDLAFSSISIRVSYIDNLPLQQHFHFVGDVGIKATNY